MRVTHLAITEIERRLANLVRIAVIESVDVAKATARVAMGDIHTTDLPWINARAGDARTGWAPTVGEQVLVLSPSGDLAQGIILPSLYTDANSAPTGYGDKAKVTQYGDGAVIAYDPDTHTLDAKLPSGGKANLQADGGVHITGDTLITGKLRVTDETTLDADTHCAATVTADTDVIGGGIKLKTHKHKGVTSGSSVSGPPQP